MLFRVIMAHWLAGNVSNFEWWWLTCRCTELTCFLCVRSSVDACICVCSLDLKMIPITSFRSCSFWKRALCVVCACLCVCQIRFWITVSHSNFLIILLFIIRLFLFCSFFLSSLCCSFCSYLNWINYNLRLLITQNWVLIVIFRTVFSLFWCVRDYTFVLNGWSTFIDPI